MRNVYVVLPGGVDDPGAPSGGNRYDRELCDGLARSRDVYEIAIQAPWPYPPASACDVLARTLGAVPDGATVVLDGLVAGAVPEVLEPAARRLRLILLVHLPLADETGLAPDEATRLAALERRTLRAAAEVITTSAAAARRLAGRYGVPARRLHVAPPGVLPAPLTAGTPAGNRLLCVAAVIPRKGQDVLLDALTTVDDLPWSCVCVGSLDRTAEFAAAQERRAGRTRFVGPLAGAALDAAYAEADLLVLPSRAETYGMVVAEALARGLPVLATAVGGVPEALGAAPDGTRPGMLVPPADPAALAAGLRRWLTDAAWRNRLRASARSRRDHLPGWDETVRRVSEVLDR
jgi:glycosyltransferase involved in cell wall biosynthesis